MDIPDLKKLQKLITFCRKNYINTAKIGDFEFHISPEGLIPKIKSLTPTGDSLPDQPQYTEEDMLFWSSTPIADTPQSNN